MQDKKSYPRPCLYGFFVQNPPKEMGTDPISFFNASITHSQNKLIQHRVKEIHFIEFEKTTAVRIRINDQQYTAGWSKLARDIFAEASRILGGEAVLELNDEISDKIKKMFKEKERSDTSSIHQFKVLMPY